MTLDLPKIVDALLSERSGTGQIVWQRDQEWLASLVVALVEERARHWACPDCSNLKSKAEGEQLALRNFYLDPAKYAELKKRLESVKLEGK